MKKQTGLKTYAHMKDSCPKCGDTMSIPLRLNFEMGMLLIRCDGPVGCMDCESKRFEEYIGSNEADALFVLGNGDESLAEILTEEVMEIIESRVEKLEQRLKKKIEALEELKSTTNSSEEMLLDGDVKYATKEIVEKVAKRLLSKHAKTEAA